MDERRLLFEMRELHDRVTDLERDLARERAEHDALARAVRTGDVCGELGHEYRLPSQMIRDRIANGWKVPRVCKRCGEAEGEWKPADWTLPAEALL